MYSTGLTPLSSTALTNCSVITSGVFTFPFFPRAPQK